VIDPSRISAAAQKKEKENYKFRAFLKNNADYDELDKHFLELHNELFSGYDCCKCNNCCRGYSTVVQMDDVSGIAPFLGMSEQEFIDKHLIQSADGFEIKAPCPFLKESGECAIQECKPSVCRDFPHTDKPDRLGSLLSVLSSAEICPVVFEILERLKERYRFRARR